VLRGKGYITGSLIRHGRVNLNELVISINAGLRDRKTHIRSGVAAEKIIHSLKQSTTSSDVLRHPDPSIAAAPVLAVNFKKLMIRMYRNGCH
jgi:hypothetical protein